MIEMMQTIQQNIKELNTTMSYLNQRITKIEKQVGIKTPIQTNVSSNTENNGNKNQDNTSQQLQTQSTYGRNNNNENTKHIYKVHKSKGRLIAIDMKFRGHSDVRLINVYIESN